MTEPTPHVGLIYAEQVPPVLFDDFVGTVTAPGLDLIVESRPNNGSFAGLAWLIPTSVVLFIAQGYFNGFLNEMGKDHYALLKAGLKALRRRFRAVKVTPIGTPGKASQDQPYSLVYSIHFDGEDGRVFKFLVPNDGEDEGEADRIMDVFADFLQAYATGELTPEATEMLAKGPSAGGTALIAFNPATGRIEPIHPVTRAFGPDPAAP